MEKVAYAHYVSLYEHLPKARAQVELQHTIAFENLKKIL
ncbi:transcription termination factor Rho [Prevotella intermedia ZT]|uniref:Transcription termination factor Rho n=1 Tax=Prevotella intermedia ZT TaxID=1347790 RepID=A0AAP0YZ04_PREIN|nr:transcription termination factor Rho [Prevotella intermedia ZT]